MIVSDTIWSELQTPIDVTGETTTITLQDGISGYQINMGSVDTEINFVTTALNQAMLANDTNAFGFDLFISMGSTVHTIEFPENVIWLCDLPPVMNAPNKLYLIHVWSLDGGETYLATDMGSVSI